MLSHSQSAGYAIQPLKCLEDEERDTKFVRNAVACSGVKPIELRSNTLQDLIAFERKGRAGKPNCPGELLRLPGTLPRLFAADWSEK